MELLLDKNELIDLGKSVQGLSIICTEGHCWVTQTGDNRDHVLENGASFLAGNNGHLIVTATNACRIKLRQQQKWPIQLLKRIMRPEFSVPRFS